MKKKKEEKIKQDSELAELEELLGQKERACQACGGEIKVERVNLEEFEAGKLYLMENVPCFVCQNCGEVWVPKPILDEFEKMIETAKAASKARHKKNTKKRN